MSNRDWEQCLEEIHGLAEAYLGPEQADQFMQALDVKFSNECAALTAREAIAQAAARSKTKH
jgi:hypothetical protein